MRPRDTRWREQLLAYIEENETIFDGGPRDPFTHRIAADLGWDRDHVVNRLHRLRLEGKLEPSSRKNALTREELLQRRV